MPWKNVCFWFVVSIVVAEEFNVAVVIINQVTADPGATAMVGVISYWLTSS